MSDDELLSAYADGIGELGADERRRVDELLASDAAARADLDATRALLGQLRELPREEAPDLSHAIGRAVGPDVPRPWWRNWRWLVPIGALAATAVAALIWLRAPSDEPAPVAAPAHDAGTGTPSVLEPSESSTSAAIWLAGQIIDLDETGDVDAKLDAIDTRDALASDGDVTGGILPASDLDWIEHLDDAAIERAERFLEKKPT
jgi:hypothetical protein